MRAIITIFFLGLISNIAIAQPTLWGMTSKGGANDCGTIFKFDVSTGLQSLMHSFMDNGRNPMYGNLCQSSNGKLYGLTPTGGSYGSGTLFEYNPVSKTYTNLYSFRAASSASNNGSQPFGSLVEANNGKLYGMTTFGGANGHGVIFEFDPTTNTYLQKLGLFFIGVSTPYGSLCYHSNGKLYGVTKNQSPNIGKGSIIEYDPITNTGVKKFDFNGINGEAPYGSLIEANNGNLYGMTLIGGQNSSGVLFEYSPITNTYTKKRDFTGVNGKLPYGNLIQTNNGLLYGMTSAGGIYDQGVMFEYDIASNNFVKKFDFNTTNGTNPNGSLIQGNNGLLYGLTSRGGNNGEGVLFEYNLNSSSFNKIVDFSQSINGRFPNGSITQANSGVFYGMTSSGGINDGGIIFELNLTTNSYNIAVDFNSYNLGRNPMGSLLLASNHKLYGMTSEGGCGVGILFEFNPITNSYSKIVDFATGQDGRYPQGSLIEVGNGKLYGMTKNGGVHDKGNIFEYDIATNTFSVKYSFGGVLSHGRHPYGDLLLATNGNLYGMTSEGGTYNQGVIFEYNPTTNMYITRKNFDSNEKPKGSLIQASNGNLYAMTGSSANYCGEIFEYNLSSNAYLTKFSFGNNYFSTGNLIETSNNRIGGMLFSLAQIFEFDYLNNINNYLYSNTTSNHLPQGSLIKASNGKLYGLITNGGTNYVGELFEFNTITNQYIKKFDFNGGNGAYPYYTNLIETGAAIAVSENSLSYSSIVYPNPGTGTFQFSNIEKQSTIEIYDISGREIFKVESNEINYQINLSEKEKGIYFYKITNENKEIKQGKLLLQ